MNCKGGVFLLCVFTVVLNQGALAETEENSEEIQDGEEINSSSHNENISLETGVPDSHEAMNNREINLSARDKRSYEFLVGLIKNNTEYEVTSMDSSNKPLRISQEEDPKATTSEILLELMVKIASHPDLRSKVHNLLENIDNDLTSKKIVEDLQNARIKAVPNTATGKASVISLEKKKSGMRKNNFENYITNNEWPTFQDYSKVNRDVNSVNTVPPEDYRFGNDQVKISYPKTFAYHRVTGRPMFFNKSPKAYIAVSVIAPKPMIVRSKNEDFILEKQLRQLKPWTHNQNLKNMASIRSRWIIQRDNDKKK